MVKNLPSDEREVVEASIAQLVVVKAALKSIQESATEKPVAAVAEFVNSDKATVTNGVNEFNTKVFNNGSKNGKREDPFAFLDRLSVSYVTKDQEEGGSNATR